MRGNKQKCLQWLSNQPAGTYEVKKFDKRSLSQNNYYWELLGQLGEITGMTNDELHFDMLRDYSTAMEIECDPQVDVPNFVKYCEVDYVDDYGRVHWKCYKGSSEMTKAEFNRLLEGVLDACRNCEIETMTPDEIARLRQ